jgi:hypothetical protein
MLTRLVKQLRARFPTKLPVGKTEFDSWADSIIELSGPFADKDSMLFAIASILIHADSKFGAIPTKYFVDRLRKSAANQVASQVFQDIKTKQQEQQKATEVTAANPEATPSDGQKV